MPQLSETTVPIITIDGPSGVGKSTLAIKFAQTFGLHYLNSGALYRLLALKITKVGEAFASPQELAKNLDIRFDNARSYLEGEDVTNAIRDENIGLLASKISAIPEVRQALLERQRAFAEPPGLVTDGRDMGSVVFPQATVKFYLDASAQIRAERREAQLKAEGISVTFADLLSDIERRDQQDKTRLIAPLIVPDEAIVIDTGALTEQQVFEKMQTEVVKRLRLIN